jgi:hypothetical protein
MSLRAGSAACVFTAVLRQQRGSVPQWCRGAVAVRGNGLSTEWLFDGWVDGGSFRLHVGIVLGPTPKPGDFVITDHFGRHEGELLNRSCCRHG